MRHVLGSRISLFMGLTAGAVAPAWGSGCASPPPTENVGVTVSNLKSAPTTGCNVSNASNFNGTPIAVGDFLWFSSVAKITGTGSSPVHVFVRGAHVQFAAGGASYDLPVPDAELTLTPGATSAAAGYDSASQEWQITAPTTYSGNVLLSAMAYPLSVDLPGGINPVTWTANIESDTPGVTVSWQWATAVYAELGAYGALGVKAADDPQLTGGSSDHAGTPENYAKYVVGGARGGGGGNYTGSLSGTVTTTPSGVGVCEPTPGDAGAGTGSSDGAMEVGAADAASGSDAGSGTDSGASGQDAPTSEDAAPVPDAGFTESGVAYDAGAPDVSSDAGQCSPPPVDLAVTLTGRNGQPLPLGSGANAEVTVETRGPNGSWQAASNVVVNLDARPHFDIALVADNSGSETGHLKDETDALRPFVSQMLARDPYDRLGLVRVSTNSSILQPLTRDQASLDAAIGGLFINHGWTALWDGVQQANDVLQAGAPRAPRARRAPATPAAPRGSSSSRMDRTTTRRDST